MSTPDNAPPPPARRFTAGQIVMLVIGILLLIPGACSVLFIISMIPEISRGDPYLAPIAAVWSICFMISAIGVALIYVARKNSGQGSPMSSSGPPPAPWRYTAGQIVMMVFGALLLLPGICTVIFIVAAIPEIFRGEGQHLMFAAVWVICLFISAMGIGLIYMARKGTKKAD